MKQYYAPPKPSGLPTHIDREWDTLEWNTAPQSIGELWKTVCADTSKKGSAKKAQELIDYDLENSPFLSRLCKQHGPVTYWQGVKWSGFQGVEVELKDGTIVVKVQKLYTSAPSSAPKREVYGKPLNAFFNWQVVPRKFTVIGR